MRMDFLGLQAFVSIAERGSFQGAAAQLNLSQTALSHRMKKFEDYFGVKLMLRSARQVTLTQAGRELLPKAMKIIAEVQSSLHGLRAHGESAQKQLCIGCLPTLASRYLPRLLASFADAEPGIAVRVYDNSAAEILELVRSGVIEFAVTSLVIDPSGLETRPLMKEPFLLIAPSTLPIAQKSSVGWADLVGMPLVRISSQASNRILIDDALREHHEKLLWRYEVQHAATAISMVAAGNGLTIVPRSTMELMRMPGLCGIPLRNPSISRTVALVSRRDEQLSPAATLLMDMLQREIRNRGAARQPHGRYSSVPAQARLS
jgi:DNA-binding transcriptional LysR family regulator